MQGQIRTRGSSRLSSNERKILILKLCQSFSTLKSTEEVADVFTDLLTPKEIETIAKRLHIAEMLAEGKDYGAIRQKLAVGFSTIARVNTWLNLAGDGFKILFSRRKPLPKKVSNEEKYDPLSWHNIKRRYSLYFWPQLLIEELMKESDSNQRKKLEQMFEKLELKRRRFNSQANKLLYEQFTKG